MRLQLAAVAYAGGWSVVRHAPEPVAQAAFRAAADAAYHRQGRSVRRLAANLRRVLGPEASEDELAAVVHAGMRSYLRYWLEVFRLPSYSADRVLGSMNMQDADRLRSAYAADRGLIAVLPHMGNWDYAGAWCVRTGMPFTTVAERLEPASLFDRFVEFRESLGMEVVPLTGGSAPPYGLLAQRLESGGMLCLLGDRDLTATGVEVSFFGEKARMPAGPASLALDTGAALLPVTLWYPDRGAGWCGRTYPEVVPPGDASMNREARVTAMTQAVADAFAESIAAHPQDWHMLQKVFAGDLDPSRDTLRRGPSPDAKGAAA